MSTTGSAFSAMFNVNGGRFDRLQVWDGTKYIDVADMLSTLPGLESEIEADKARLTALEAEVASLQDKVESLDNEKAPLFVAVEPLHLKTDVSRSSSPVRKFHRRRLPQSD